MIFIASFCIPLLRKRYYTAPVNINKVSIIIAENFTLMPDKCDPELVAAFFSRVAVAEGISEDEDEDDDWEAEDPA